MTTKTHDTSTNQCYTNDLLTHRGCRMLDPKPQLSHAAVKANIEHYHNLLDQLDSQRDLLKEQLDYWLTELKALND